MLNSAPLQQCNVNTICFRKSKKEKEKNIYYDSSRSHIWLLKNYWPWTWDPCTFSWLGCFLLPSLLVPNSTPYSTVSKIIPYKYKALKKLIPHLCSFNAFRFWFLFFFLDLSPTPFEYSLCLIPRLFIEGII